MTQANQACCLHRENREPFVELFRTTPVNTVCPNFYVLSHANGCLFSPQCSYCYLKDSAWYAQRHQVFTNLGKLEADVRAWIAQDGLETYVLNAGNLSDSLCFEEVRPLVGRLVGIFRDAERAGRPHTLLLVTKGGRRECEPLLATEPCANVVVSFSVNDDAAAADHEQGAAAPEDRFAAAETLKAAGWRVRMRIDPMIYGYDYADTIARVAALAPERVTLGCLRAEENLPRQGPAELFGVLEPPPEPSALARYPRELRMALYRPAVEALRGVCPVGLCEETPDVWAELGLPTDVPACNCGA